MVHRSGWVGEHGSEQRFTQGIGGEEIQAPVVDDGRQLGHSGEDARHAGSELLGRGRAPGADCGAGGVGEVGQVSALRLVQLQCAGEGVEHALGDAAEVAPLESGVVLDTHAGEVGHLTAAQALHAPVAAVVLQPGPLRGQLGPPGAEKGVDLIAVVHRSKARAVSSDEGCPVSTPLGSDSPGLPPPACMVLAAAGRGVGHHATGT